MSFQREEASAKVLWTTAYLAFHRFVALSGAFYIPSNGTKFMLSGVFRARSKDRLSNQ